ncbi:MAG: GAF domain-containing protein [Desulfobacteraceae bacterium]|jgi:two-component system cell cycle sensor histidine kinase/response regulator CckA|nr:GAF domain-containing protein [Desulfobacteraceae bacterium]
METKLSNHRLLAKDFMRIRLRLFEYATSHSLEKLLQKTLDEVEILTQSSVGFYHFVERDQKTLSLQAWSTRTLKEFCKAEGKGMHYDIDQAGVWVDCLHQRRPVIHNDYASLPHKKGMPPGHAAVVRELVVPIMKDDWIVAILGVGNKPTDYTEKDIEIVSFLADVAWVIVEQKRLEIALSYEKEKLSVTLRSIGDGVIATDLKGRVVFINKVAETLSGWMQDEACGRPLSEVFHIINELTRERCESPFDKTLKANAIVELADHTILISRDGTERPIADSCAPVLDTKSELLGMVLVFRDQTKELTARRAVERQQQLLVAISRGQTRFIADNDPAGVFDDILSDLLALTDSEYGFIGEVLFSPEGQPYLKTYALTNIAWNKETREFYDQNAPNGLEFRNLKTLFGAALISGEPVIVNDPLHAPRRSGLPEGHPPVKTFLAIPIHLNGKLFAMAGMANRPGGYDKKLLDFLNPFLVSIAQLVEAFRHRAERKRSEDELRQYEHIVSSAKDMLALLDKDFVYLAANGAYLQAFAKTPDEMIGRTVTDVFGEAFFSTVVRPRAERCMAGEDIRYQDWFEFPATGRRYMDVAYSPHFGPDNEIRGFVVTARDITKIENLQAQLRQAQKIESVGRLAGGVAHDYNNALSAIIGFTEMAMTDLAPNDPNRENLDEVLKAAKRATEITRQLLAFARKQTIAPKVLDVNERVESMFNMLQRLIGEDIDLAWLPGKMLWPVKMDPSQVDQILINLCVNARDAIDGVGKVTIETTEITFDTTYCDDHAGFVSGDFVQLAVSDNGCGMDGETLDNIFEPFFTTKDVNKGTGLGLATVYGIVKQNNGFINVYSEPGKGTTFRIYLPRHQGKIVEIQDESPAEIPHSRGETVLIVEDDLQILKLARQILKGLGYTVLISGTPLEAIGLAEESAGEIHLLVTDVIMPEMNGRELSERLKAFYPDLKCIFMSGYTANVIAHHGVLDEGVQFIQKPFSRRDLAISVRKALDS